MKTNLFVNQAFYFKLYSSDPQKYNFYINAVDILRYI